MKKRADLTLLTLFSFFVLANLAVSQDNPTKDKPIPIGQNKPPQDNVPKAITFPEPMYPDNVAPTHWHGEMRLYIKVDTKGRVTVFDSFGPNAPCSNLGDAKTKAIRKAVIEATEKALFEVPMKDGVPMEKSLMIKFDLAPKNNSKDGSEPDLVQGNAVMKRTANPPKPQYPAKARSERVSGAVSVQVLIDEKGKVISAAAVDGHRLLREAPVETACKTNFSPTRLAGQPVKVSGTITYNFIP